MRPGESMKYAGFPCSPLEAALSLLTVDFFFVYNNFWEGIKKTREISINVRSLPF